WARLNKIYFANTRKDAAKINFDDDLIYQEIPKPIENRKIPMQQLMQNEAQLVFKDWEKKENKTLY
ncbi:MAG: tRNA-specific adenosine deaminase, partial [Bdellovibrionales bacterium]